MLYFTYPSIAESYNSLSAEDKETQLPVAHLILKTIKQKQLVELYGLDTKKGTIAYARDPAVLMFQPYEAYLILYIKTISMLKGKECGLSFLSLKVPDWLNDKKYINYCRKKLVLENALHYSQFNWFNSYEDQKFLLSDLKSYYPIQWTSPLLGGAG